MGHGIKYQTIPVSIDHIAHTSVGSWSLDWLTTKKDHPRRGIDYSIDILAHLLVLQFNIMLRMSEK